MENASKALIIAGAILLAILLISLGIMIFNQAQDTVNNNGMSQAEVTAFNNKFLKYEGDQKGSVVKSLISEVQATNADENNKSAGRNITLTGDVTTTSAANTTKTYKVSIESYADDGTVKQIKIEAPETTP